MKSTIHVVLVAAIGMAGCVGAPSPLAPNVSGSVGVPHSGVLTDGVELPRRGAGFARLRPRSPNYWGNPRLISAIQDAARGVFENLPGGEPLLVGDISAKGGGQLVGHHSHRTGRDADLLLFLTTPSGAPIPSPGFVKIGSDGLGKIEGEGVTDPTYVRLDVERQWRLVKELVASPKTVQWLFVSRGIEALLVDYARARGEEPYLIWRAESMMLEPGDSTPHDDHVHLRIACLDEETLAGCEGGGPHWTWLGPEPELPELDPKTLGEIARDDPFALEPLATGPTSGGGA